nr:unnamed protein product [Callosobruchus chinensis]
MIKVFLKKKPKRHLMLVPLCVAYYTQT